MSRGKTIAGVMIVAVVSWRADLFAQQLSRHSRALSHSARGVEADGTEAARKLFRRAETHFGVGEFEEALKLYRDAYRTKPLPGFHFNIAQCYRNLGQHKRSIFHFRQYLALSKNGRQRKVAQDLLSEMESELARKKHVPTDNDGLQNSSEKGRGGRVFDDVDAAGDGRGSEEPARKIDDGMHRRRLKPIYFWSGVGLSAALFAGATVTGILALNQKSTFDDAPLFSTSREDAKRTGESYRNTTNVLLGLGVAAVVGTTALYFFSDFSNVDESGHPANRVTRVAAAPLVEGGGQVVISGAF